MCSRVSCWAALLPVIPSHSEVLLSTSYVLKHIVLQKKEKKSVLVFFALIFLRKETNVCNYVCQSVPLTTSSGF